MTSVTSANRVVCFGLISLWIGLLNVAPVLAQEAEQRTVVLEDNGRPLVNPDMGWTLHYYSNIISNYGSKLEPSDTLDEFPGLSTIYLRLPWSFLEPEEGKFDWSVVDTPAQRWITMARVYSDGPREFTRSATEGTCDVFISVGTLDGTPTISLPLDNDDGQHRYRVGTVRVTPRKATP